MFFWTKHNETPLTEAVVFDDLDKIQELGSHPDHLYSTNHLGFSALDLCYFLDKQKALEIVDPQFDKVFKVLPSHEEKLREFNIDQFEEFFSVRYISQLKFSSYVDFSKIVRSCPRSVKNGNSGSFMRDLYQQHKEKLKKGFVVDSTIKWIDETMGYGLFTNHTIEEGDLVGEYCGEMQLKSLLFNGYGEYCFRYPRFSMGIQYYTLNGEKAGNEMRFANHSYTPNMQPTASLENGLSHTLFLAKKKIVTGEQLTYDYGEDYWARREPPQDL